jgi:hypothetical protein
MADKVMSSATIPEALAIYYRKYKRSTKGWSFCLYTFLFGAAALSATAGILPQLTSAKDVASVLAVTAALFNTVSGIGRFDQKWQASRTARAAVEKLHIAMVDPHNSSGVAPQLQQVITDQSAGVIGSHSPAAGQGDPHAGPADGENPQAAPAEGG